MGSSAAGIGPSTATITSTGTSASGFYTFSGTGPLSAQTTFSSVNVGYGSTVQVSGGTVDNFNVDTGSTLNLSRDSNSSFGLYIGSGTANLFGTNFSKSFAYGTGGGRIYNVSGTLSDNRSFFTQVYMRYHLVYPPTGGFATEVEDGTLNFLPPAAVPETSSAVSLGLMLALGLGGMALRARRGKALEAA